MRLPALILVVFLGMPIPVKAADYSVPSSHKDMLYVTVTSSNVRLRAGADTGFEELGMARQGSRYIADAQPHKDSTGKTWFRLIAGLEQQTELAVYTLDVPCWIRSDFIKTRPLREVEADRVDSLFFRILSISPDGLPHFTLAQELPVCSDEDDCLFVKGKPVPDKTLPAGDSLILFTVVQNGDNSCVNLWKDTGRNSIQLAGTILFEEMQKIDFGSNKTRVERWLKDQEGHILKR